MSVKFSAGTETVELAESDAESLFNLIGFHGPLREAYSASEMQWNLAYAMDCYCEDPEFEIAHGHRQPFDVDVIYSAEQMRSIVDALTEVAAAAGDGVVTVSRTAN